MPSRAFHQRLKRGRSFTLRSPAEFMTDGDETNLLCERRDTIFNENVTIISMLLLNTSGGTIKLQVDS